MFRRWLLSDRLYILASDQPEIEIAEPEIVITKRPPTQDMLDWLERQEREKRRKV